MGRTRRARAKQERALGEALNAAMEEGRRRGLVSALRSAASYVLGEERREAAPGGEERPRYGSWASRWRAALYGPLSALSEAVAPASPRASRWLSGHLDELSGQLAKTSRENVERALREISEEGLEGIAAAEEFRRRMGEVSASRVDLISEHQSHLVPVEALDRAVEESGAAVRRYWSTQGDDLVREEHEEREGTEMGEDGTWNGDRPGMKPRCRCSIRYEAGEDAPSAN